MFKVHIGHTWSGRLRWRKFDTLEAAQLFCEDIFQRTGLVLAIIAV